MTSTQQDLLHRRTKELENIADTIEGLNLSSEWTKVFTQICFHRGWRYLKPLHLEQIQNIADTNSKAVLTLAQYGKKVGLKQLNELSTGTDNEAYRKKAVTLILEQGVKQSRSGVDIILSMNVPSLFNEN